MTEQTRIALADDQALIRTGLRALLESQPGYQVCVEAADGRALLDELISAEVDIVLCDIRMPKLDGIGVVRTLRQGANRLPVLLLTTFADDALFKRATEAGANGFVLKDIEPDALFAAIDAVRAGKTILEPQALTAVRGHADLPRPESFVDALDDKELAILRLMSSGLSNRQIAERLHKAEGTIKNRVSVILQKLDARDRTQAVLKAITNGII